MTQKIFDIQKVIISVLLLAILSISSVGMISASDNVDLEKVMIETSLSKAQRDSDNDQVQMRGKLEDIQSYMHKLSVRNDSLKKYLAKETYATLVARLDSIKDNYIKYINSKDTQYRKLFREGLYKYNEIYLKSIKD